MRPEADRRLAARGGGGAAGLEAASSESVWRLPRDPGARASSATQADAKIDAELTDDLMPMDSSGAAARPCAARHRGAELTRVQIPLSRAQKKEDK